MSVFKSHGKLLLTGEYLVLDGAKALAVPTKFGQTLKFKEEESGVLKWRSYDEQNTLWFEATFKIQDSEVATLKSSDIKVSQRLETILNSTLKLNSEWLQETKGYNIETYLDFNLYWGLGTSSTLINNLASSAGVDPYTLLKMTFGGSGYDIACAKASGPITFQLGSPYPKVAEVSFNPDFKDKLYFVYLNKKQNSRDGIQHYKNQKPINSAVFSDVNTITEAMISCKTLNDFESLLESHESLISKIIKQDPIQKSFSEYHGKLKSLGAWGGDFILATSEIDPRAYFKSKGLDTVIPYVEMVLK
ncbi:GYDIA family GHMP kinase [Winogradskyella sp. A3E31]|uniref:GYDIA family GHMP kinase n=1 Tax=Winogradskyella sp. A3E31 TaxID=3349637 RepID=UPI00398A655A